MRNVLILVTGLMLVACGTPKSVRVADSMRVMPELAEDAEYVKNEYLDTYSNQSIIARDAIVAANLVNDKLDRLNGLNLFDYANGLNEITSLLAGNNSRVWRNAIHEDYSVDFNLALSIMKKEMNRKGVYSNMNQAKENLKGIINTDVENHVELFVSLGELIDLAVEPTGSLVNYNQMVSRAEQSVKRSLVKLELD